MICMTCKVNKAVTEFSNSSRRKCGKQNNCKVCARQKAKESVTRRGGNRRLNLMRNYKISEEYFNEMLNTQGGFCKVCSGPALGKGAYHVDHDHKTGRIRGLLCHKCNVALGMVQDSKEHLSALIRYLELT